MKEKILNKIQEKIEQILAKENIDYEETQILWNYLTKIESEEAREKMEAERLETKERFQQIYSSLI